MIFILYQPTLTCHWISLDVIIVGYEYTGQLIPIMYARSETDPNDYFHISFQNLTCACMTSLSDQI
jgi:hypothetical protein